MSKLVTVNAWTDGSTHPKNPGRGGWGSILLYKDSRGYTHELQISGPMPSPTTNNQAETQAVTETIKALKKPAKLVIHTDSHYVILGFEKVQNGVLPKANKKYWQELRQAYKKFKGTVSLVKVKGHNGDPGNEAADKLAYAAASESKEVEERSRYKAGANGH